MHWQPVNRCASPLANTQRCSERQPTTRRPHTPSAVLSQRTRTYLSGMPTGEEEEEEEEWGRSPMPPRAIARDCFRQRGEPPRRSRRRAACAHPATLGLAAVLNRKYPGYCSSGAGGRLHRAEAGLVGREIRVVLSRLHLGGAVPKFVNGYTTRAARRRAPIPVPRKRGAGGWWRERPRARRAGAGRKRRESAGGLLQGEIGGGYAQSPRDDGVRHVDRCTTPRCIRATTRWPRRKQRSIPATPTAQRARAPQGYGGPRLRARTSRARA